MYTVRMHPLITIFFSAMLILISWLMYISYKAGDFTDMPESREEKMVMLFFLICMYLFMILSIAYSLRHRIKVYVDYIEVYPFFGVKKTYKWNEIGAVEVIRTKQGEQIKLYDMNDKKICAVDPVYVHCKDFIETVQVHHGRIFRG